MEIGKTTFKVSILNAQKLIYHNDVKSIKIFGDETEYELLPYHSPLLGVLKKGNVIVDSTIAIPVEKGLVRFYENECIILAEEKDHGAPKRLDADE